MIIDLDNFKGLLKLETNEITTYVTDLIEQKESTLLNKWFGYAFAKDLLSASPSAVALTILNGKEYTDNSGDLQKIKGLKEILLYFLYFYVSRDKATFDTTIGQQSALAENTKPSTPLTKGVNNYNLGVDYLKELFNYILDNPDDYPTVNLEYYLGKINVFGI